MKKEKCYIIFIVGIIIVIVLGIAAIILQNQYDSIKASQNNIGEESSFVLDDQYANSYRKATSNYEKCEINIQFSKKWKQEAEDYINKICEIADDDFRQALIAAQSAWENTYQTRKDENLAYLQYIYDSGTIVPILHSKYEYDIQRTRAIELYEMYNKVIQKTGDGSLSS